MFGHNYIKETIIMALEPGYTYSTGNVTGSTGPLDVKSSTSAPLVDFSRTVTATGTLTGLPAESSQQVNIINSSAGILYVSVNSGSAISLPTSTGALFSTINTSVIRISGSGAIGYIVSK